MVVNVCPCGLAHVLHVSPAGWQAGCAQIPECQCVFIIIAHEWGRGVGRSFGACSCAVRHKLMSTTDTLVRVVNDIINLQWINNVGPVAIAT